jgi:6-phosphogluconolactonase
MSLGPTLAVSLLFAAVTMSSASQFIFVGTNTPKASLSRGIYRVSFDSATGTFTDPVLAAEIPNPTFIVRDGAGRHLYAVNESDVIDGKPGGAATAFALDAASGQLSTLGTQTTGGGGCAHLGLDATERMLTLISYGGGEITTFPVTRDGRIGPRTGRLTNTGQLGPNAARQEKPHPHSVTYSPDNRFAYVCDLGLDKVFTYRVDAAAAMLMPAGKTATAPGAGPRHSKFSADGRFFYVIDELASTITTFACDAATGGLTPGQTVSTLPKDFSGTNICAEIRIHPNGRFIYGSNRGHDSIAVFARDQATGMLSLVEVVPCGGAHPRNFALSDDGSWLVCANRDSNNLVSFRVDPATGRLTASGQKATVPSPTCVLFVNGR